MQNQLKQLPQTFLTAIGLVLLALSLALSYYNPRNEGIGATVTQTNTVKTVTINTNN